MGTWWINNWAGCHLFHIPRNYEDEWKLGCAQNNNKKAHQKDATTTTTQCDTFLSWNEGEGSQGDTSGRIRHLPRLKNRTVITNHRERDTIDIYRVRWYGGQAARRECFVHTTKECWWLPEWKKQNKKQDNNYSIPTWETECVPAVESEFRWTPLIDGMIAVEWKPFAIFAQTVPRGHWFTSLQFGGLLVGTRWRRRHYFGINKQYQMRFFSSFSSQRDDDYQWG